MNLTMFFLILFLILAVVVAILVFVMAGKHKITEKHKKIIRKEWKTIIELAKTSPESALVKADNLLDYILKVKGFNGTLGEKLKKADIFFHDINGIWEAHKTRNRIAHEVGFKLTSADAAKHLIKIKNALKDLGVNFQ